MQEPGRRPFAGVDLRRPKGYPAPSTAPPAPVAPAEEEAGDPCPRCESRDTKFCYYNNYNTSQPRHYCRSCRRYWTKGGSLRNVPIGGGSRKGASSSSSSSSSASSASPKRAKNSKRRRVAPPEPEPGATDVAAGAAAADKEDIAGTIGYRVTDVDAAGESANDAIGDPATAVDDAAPKEAKANGTVDAARTEATADSATDDAGVPTAADDGGFAHPSVAEEPFEWPSGCDLGSYWAPGVFADTDPVLFLNLP